jgi:HK97 family phage portal protein
MNWLRKILTGGSNDYGSRSIENPSVPLSAATLEDFATGSVGSSAGMDVTPRTALGYAPLYQAVDMISGDCAKISAGVFQRTRRGRTLIYTHPLYERIRKYGSANAEVNNYKFWKRFFVSYLLWRNAYAFIDRQADGTIHLYNLLPDRIAPMRRKGEIWYFTEVAGKIEVFHNSDILHVEGLSINNAEGESVLKLFREDFGVALARRRFTAKFFSQNMTAGGILTVPPNAKPEAIRKIKSAMNEKFSGSNNDAAFKTLVLREGFRWYATQVEPEKAQLIEMDEQQARNVARMFNLDPSRLGVTGSSSYNSDEMARRNYHDGALSHLLIATASEMNHKILTAEEKQRGMYVEHNINALLWADSVTRSQIANVGIVNGRFSPNETRAWENMDDYDGGDTYYQPLNVTPVGSDPDGSQNGATRQLFRALLEEAFTRAANRLGIKAERAKDAKEVLANERAAVLQILSTPVAAASVGKWTQDRSLVELGKFYDQFKGSVDSGASALRSSFDVAAKSFIDSILTEDQEYDLLPTS